MTFMKVETDIITSKAARPIGGAVILMIMYVETLKTDFITICLDISWI
jgi:hypothetical protein